MPFWSCVSLCSEKLELIWLVGGSEGLETLGFLVKRSEYLSVVSTSWLTRQPNRLNQIAVAFPTQCSAGSLK